MHAGDLNSGTNAKLVALVSAASYDNLIDEAQSMIALVRLLLDAAEIGSGANLGRQKALTPEILLVFAR